MFRITLAMFALACLIAPAEARHRAPVFAPGCNIFFPCEGAPPAWALSKPVSVRSRGEAVVRAMGGFGTARKARHHLVAKTRRNSDLVAREQRQPRVGGSGIVRSASGATAHVAASATGAFQCLVSALDRQGYPIRFMGGWRAHGSVRGSLHPAGLALDVNQLSRNVTRPAMPGNEVALANGCGLISGHQWAHGDSGHFQLGGWAGGRRHYASRRRHIRYASAR